jgi:CheY-like chemotaxis protein
MARRIEEAGGTAVGVDNAAEALAKLATTPFDTLIVDAGFGEDVLRSVADEARRAGVSRNLILLSPFDRREFGSPSAAGFDGYLVKPVRAHSLFQQLAEPVVAPAPPRGTGSPRRPPGPPERRFASFLPKTTRSTRSWR